MALTPRLRKLALTAHVTASVGWLGAVIAFLALSIAGLTSPDPQTVQGAYLVMELTGWVVLVPLSLGSLATGLVCSLGSTWGLFRHDWVLFKLVINVVAIIVLLLYGPGPGGSNSRSGSNWPAPIGHRVESTVACTGVIPAAVHHLVRVPQPPPRPGAHRRRDR